MTSSQFRTTDLKLVTKKHQKGRLLDPLDLLHDAMSGGLENSLLDVEEDDDFPEAPNAVDWLISPKYLNVKPFPKQLEDAIHLFSAACYHCSDAPYLANIPVDAKLQEILERTQLMKHGRCPRCKRLVTEMRHEWCLDPKNTFEGRIKSQPPNDCVLLEGQRSGKSVKTGMFSTYVLHRILKLSNPSRWFGLMRDVGGIFGTFASVTLGQAKKNLWMPFTDFVTNSPWFKKYHAFLKEKGEELGEELFTWRDTFFLYRHKRVGLSPAVADQRSLRGDTRFLYALDELGWMITAGSIRSGGAVVKNVRIDGHGTARALDRSLTTLRMAAAKRRRNKPGERASQNTPDAFSFNISSPSSITDPMMQRFNKSVTNKRAYFIRRCTWASNPNVTEEDLRVQESDKSEAEFKCDFECIPPFSDCPWWDKETALLDLCGRNKGQELWSTRINNETDNGGKTWIWAELVGCHSDRQTPRCLAFDTGSTNNSFSWAMGRYDKSADIVIVEGLGEVAADKQQTIHFGKMWEHVIKVLVERFRCLNVVWDRWESTRYVADLRTIYGTKAEQVTATYQDGRLLKADMNNGRIFLPKGEALLADLPIGNFPMLSTTPKSHLLFQIMTARDQNGLPVKPDNGTDDNLRAVLLLHATLKANADEYGRGQWSGGRTVGLGSRRGQGGSRTITGQGGRTIGVGGRRR